MFLDDTHAVPARIDTFLREYQHEGVRFFWERYGDDKGGLLGDDMGLVSKPCFDFSKFHAPNRLTIRDIYPDWRERHTLPLANQTWPMCLIIAPSSAVRNWEREFDTGGA
ncbi:uncharacterized protein LAESUDRAFT_765582 [Laetiporus sulphureus 93-53]|uniref:SNF2 N-terminal domain-containing protein n=1 Tax=Laetiporus sulphureus 93-53 TaxID=1314785 RepID=A0A165APC9_9APHY|nr:uncharacterized protein LAESUDRAFT_765582 [Laetiporus sulphureus 93-53]KZS99399.1 hypothetical protein LAESUDRAFT_765582 [Laetiporus sulphureus 93-53]